MDEITLYLGTLGAIGIGGLILIVVLLTRGSGGGGRKSQQRLRSEPRAVAVPRVQVVLAEPEEGLIWVVNGRATRDLGAISDPTERRAIQLLLERVREVKMPLTLNDEVGTETSPPNPLSMVERGDMETHPPVPLSMTERGGTATHPLTPSQEGELEAEGGISVTETPPILPPATSSTYEDELTRPFLARLRDSLFGVDYDTKPSTRMYSARPPAPPKPKKGAVKESDATDSGFGIPRFEELNTLLQQRLAILPDTPPTAIRVGRDGMLEILVQGRIYDHIDDVPDDTVRQAMREAVAIWNSR